MTDKEFHRIIRYVEGRTGIHLVKKRVLVEGRLESFLAKNGYRSYDAYMDAVEGDVTGKKTEELVNILTTNHTYFMRESEHFVYFKNEVLPKLRKKCAANRDLRIWCGASSTGEEPYTLAMIVRDAFALDGNTWDTKILATDISTEVLAIAQRGRYLKEHIEPLPQSWKKRYFKSIDEDYCEAVPELKQQILFRRFNLMSPMPFRKPLQVVFLRNVMIYFDKDTKNQLLQRIYDNMEPGGYLFIGTTESIDRKVVPFRYVQPSIYQK